MSHRSQSGHPVDHPLEPFWSDNRLISVIVPKITRSPARLRRERGRGSRPTEHRLPSVCPVTSTIVSGSKMSCRSPKNVIAVNREQAPFAANYEGLPIGPGYRSVKRPDKSLSGVTLRDLIERGGEGS